MALKPFRSKKAASVPRVGLNGWLAGVDVDVSLTFFPAVLSATAFLSVAAFLCYFALMTLLPLMSLVPNAEYTGAIYPLGLSLLY